MYMLFVYKKMTMKKLKNKKKSYIPTDPHFFEQVTPNTHIGLV